MKAMASKLTKEHLEQIEGYLTEKFPALTVAARGRKSASNEIEIRERVVQIEGSLKNQQVILEKMLAFMEKRFEQIDKRFEQVEKRFEQIDKRFEQIDKRFEQVDKRFEQADKRFEEMRSDMNNRFEQVDKRFEQVDKKFTMLIWFMGFGFTLVTVFISGLITILR